MLINIRQYINMVINYHFVLPYSSNSFVQSSIVWLLVAGVTESSALGRTRRPFSRVYHFAEHQKCSMKFGIKNYPLMSTLEFLLQPAFLHTEILFGGLELTGRSIQVRPTDRTSAQSRSRSQHVSPRVIWCRTDCVMSTNDMQIGKYELPVNRGAKCYELHLVIELYGMSSRAGRWVGERTAWRTAFGRLHSVDWHKK